MAKSKLIKDIANNEISIDIALKRALIIASDLGNEVISEWITKELYGYDTVENLPPYRTLIGGVKYSFINMHGQGTLTFNTSLLGKDGPMLNRYNSLDTISVILSIIELESSKVALNQYCSAVNEFIQGEVLSVYLQIDKLQYLKVVSNIEKILLDFLLSADKEFGNLDDLDVNSSTEKVNEFNTYIISKFEHNYSIGNNNTIKNSNLINGDNDE